MRNLGHKEYRKQPLPWPSAAGWTLTSTRLWRFVCSSWIGCEHTFTATARWIIGKMRHVFRWGWCSEPRWVDHHTDTRSAALSQPKRNTHHGVAHDPEGGHNQA